MASGITWKMADRHDSRMGGYAISRLYVGTMDGNRVASIQGSKNGISSLHWTAFIEAGGLCALDPGGSEGFDKLADAKTFVAEQFHKNDATASK